MNLTIDTVLLGVISSFVASLISLVPALGATSTRRAAVAIVVTVGALLSQRDIDFTNWQVALTEFASVAVIAVINYKLITEPLIKPVAARLAGNKKVKI